ncbi:hypothetical protein [Halorubrum sp. Atlit-28R]|uniref:hypothetical protein n=1 Tax=Halorubrum sp. Atlit-28R TaxID=2282129 RepID=UPI000EF266DE|nr:hypothetical protein [Halorubrum sp. Atlit-28R]RLM49975.1 hypothetical protein DVK06_11910 [Halorubrum sp. Atlit-28R]
MEDILLQNSLWVGIVFVGVLGLILVSKTVIGSGPNTSPPSNYRKTARATVKGVHGYDDLTDHQQAFLRECAADFLQRGYELNAKIDRLEVTTSNGPRAYLTITEDATIEMLAYVKPDGWQRIDPDPADNTESELKTKQTRLNEHL